MKKIIYIIKNSINNKVYIGQTEDLDKRKIRHLFESKQNKLPLYVCMRDNGVENFSFHVLEECEPDISNEREIFWISKYSSNKDEFGFNIQSGGASVLTPELRGKFKKAGSKNFINLWKNPEWRQRRIDFIKNAHKNKIITTPSYLGKKHSENTKEKIGKANSILQKGAGNSQFGKMWMMHLTKQKNHFAQPEEIEKLLLEGWIKGRKMSW